MVWFSPQDVRGRRPLLDRGLGVFGVCLVVMNLCSCLVLRYTDLEPHDSSSLLTASMEGSNGILFNSELSAV